MAKAAFVVYAGTDSHEDLGRLTNALQGVNEFVDNGDDVVLVFDGGGTQWIEALADESHPAHGLFEAVKDVTYVCDYCAGAFHVEEAVDESDVERLNEYDGHPSLHRLVEDGYEIITF